MLLNYEDISPIKKSIEVEIPADRLSSEAQRVTNEFSRHAKLPGFRPGKIPANVVRSRFAKEIQEEVMSRLLPVSFREAIADKNVEPVGDPELEHVDAFIEGAPVKYKANFEVKPHFELSDYRGIEVDDPKVEVTEKDVDEMIERLREQASSYRPETERGLDDGDFAVIDIASTAEGMEAKHDSGHFKMGEESPLPELHDALRGKKPGDTSMVEKEYGEDASNEAFRNKKVRHDVTLKEIRVQEKPDVNDEFAKSVGGWESVAQMREVIAADLRRHRELDILRAKRNQIGDALIGSHQFDVPEALIEEELGKSLQNYARYLASQGIDLEKADLDWKRIGEDFRPEAVKRVQRSLILEGIARKEGIAVSDVEVDAEIRRAANEQGREFADVKHHLKHEGGYESLRSSLAQEKALELVLKEAKPRAA
ncbi:MAG TPA: trigger factor [Thermoanaerobaculia bacterium]|nr:trigger factor [Thermoanaerobaculia bacterium]